jgi:hypothetical protein
MVPRGWFALFLPLGPAYRECIICELSDWGMWSSLLLHAFGQFTSTWRPKGHPSSQMTTIRPTMKCNFLWPTRPTKTGHLCRASMGHDCPWMTVTEANTYLQFSIANRGLYQNRVCKHCVVDVPGHNPQPSEKPYPLVSPLLDMSWWWRSRWPIISHVLVWHERAYPPCEGTPGPCPPFHIG